MADSAKLHKWTPIGNSNVAFDGNFDGAGHTVKWNEVYSRMHLPLSQKAKPRPSAEADRPDTRRLTPWWKPALRRLWQSSRKCRAPAARL